MRVHKDFPDEFPASWASGWGEDEFGIFMGFTYKSVQQNFRWIEPGTFLMGSSKFENGRGDDETQHSVSFSKGFWLAETTVIQALWEAVMGNNPSEFRGNNYPVDKIRWDDARAFINKMNAIKPSLKLCLPTESQWEYACRAGSTTPFYCGNDVSWTQANFNGGNSEYKNAQEQYLGKTAPVKSYPPNAWGLYEMHGNVWEWCLDWYGNMYPYQPITDPKGAKYGNHRVLRGGSWLNSSRYCRSAYRAHRVPGFNGDYAGFRLAICG